MKVLFYYKGADIAKEIVEGRGRKLLNNKVKFTENWDKGEIVND